MRAQVSTPRSDAATRRFHLPSVAAHGATPGCWSPPGLNSVHYRTATCIPTPRALRLRAAHTHPAHAPPRAQLSAALRSCTHADTSVYRAHQSTRARYVTSDTDCSPRRNRARPGCVDASSQYSSCIRTITVRPSTFKTRTKQTAHRKTSMGKGARQGGSVGAVEREAARRARPRPLVS